MTSTILEVQGMSCPSCVHDIRRRVSAVDGVVAVEVDLQNGRVEVQHDATRARRTRIEDTLREGGYSVGGPPPRKSCCCG